MSLPPPPLPSNPLPVVPYLSALPQSPAGGGAWRQGSVLVIQKGTALPPTCVKCNAPADVSLRRKLYWHNPLLYLLAIFPGPLIYVIVAVCVRGSATVQVPLCQQHRRSRRRAIALSWLGVIGGLVLLIAGLSVGGILWPLSGFCVLAVAAIYGVIKASPLTAAKITRHRAYLKGACEDYLAQFPPVAPG